MACASFNGIGIRGIAAAVPSRTIDNFVPSQTFTKEDAQAVVNKTGIRYRRWAPASICASDLCFAAADRLISEMSIERDTIDALIFVTQTPDYRMPASAFLLQDRLGLTKATCAFDVNLGCSGYIYGLMLAYSLVNNPRMGRVLLLNGETRTRAYSFNDKATGLLFGDAGAATLIERAEGVDDSFFTLNSDGGRADLIMIHAGGYRNPSSVETVLEKPCAGGGMRSEEQGVMNGARVFEFLIEEIPQDILNITHSAGWDLDEIDYVLFHQANRFMNEHLRKKLKIPPEKMPYSLYDFGNTSSVSIPLTMVSQLAMALRNDRLRLLLSGFGVGLSWGSAILMTEKLVVPDLLEINGCDDDRSA